jgi:hypothetical protein
VLRLASGVLLFLLSPAVPTPARAQDAAPGEQKPKPDYFSGTITVLDEEKVTVLKTVLGKNSETRTFLITKETRIEGKLRVKARVTVRYTHDDEGNRALHIIVRTAQKK